MFSKHKLHSGFTLAEISIVVTIVVILALAVLIGLNPIAQIVKGYDTRRKADLAMIKTAFESYYADHDCYPAASILTHCGGTDLRPYLNTIPCDPNDNTPYKIYTVPENSDCPQQFAVYAPILAFFDRLANTIPTCPKTYAVYSSDMLNADIIAGCSGVKSCARKYGCQNGYCVVVAEDTQVACSPWSCDPDCGLDCSLQRPDESYVNECTPF